jgi:hypothetical protein
MRRIWQNSVKSVSNEIEAYTKRNSKRMVRMDSPRRGASFSCRTHVLTIHGCGTMKGLWGSCLEEGERKSVRGSESTYRCWPLLAHRSQRRGWLWGYARFRDIPRACAEGALRSALTMFWMQPGTLINGLSAPQGLVRLLAGYQWRPRCFEKLCVLSNPVTNYLTNQVDWEI